MSRFKKFLGFLLSLFIVLSSYTITTAQECEILFPIGTDDDYQERSYRSISPSDLSDVSWLDLENGIISDDRYISLSLEPNAFSQRLTFSNFNFNIPAGSIINGISVVVEGAATGAQPDDYIVRLNGVTNTNLANLAFSGHLWPDSVDDSWTYGASWYLWNNYWTPEIINQENFGVEIKIRNTADQSLNANIDQLKIKIDYTPPYTICSDHACIIASLQDDPAISSYDWVLPNNFHVISQSSDENLIIFSPTDDVIGNFDLCVTPISSVVSYNQCCTSFTLRDCTPGSIGDFVFDDRNDNGIQDAGDLPIEGLTISLFNDKSVFVATTVSDAAGFYEFDSIQSGDYFIMISDYEEYILASADIGNDQADSDLSEILGPGTTDLFRLNPGEIKNDIDLGLRLLSSIEGVAWIDNNGNGLNDAGELPFANLEVNLFDQNNLAIANTITDATGAYIFDFLLPDVYYVVFTNPGDYVFTMSGLDSDVDNSIVGGSTALIDAVTTNEITGIDAGLYEYIKMGDYIWFDLNRDGLQTADESGIPGLEITLIPSAGMDIKTTTNAQGFYEFTNVAPGTYSITIEKDNELQLTLFNQGNGSNDSDALMDGGIVYSSFIYVLNSGEERSDIDFGFQYKPSSISGVTWEDFNGNELNDSGEMPLASIPVALYNENNELVKETLTDATGSYTFDLLNPGNYYVVFQKTGDYQFTMFGMDSDVNSNIVEGSTNIIMLSADTDVDGIDAGYYEFAVIGDYIWLDLDRDGIQDTDESGIPNLDLQLLRPSGLIVNNTTDANGFYEFDLLPPGQYIVAIHNEADLTPSPFNQGNGTNDSEEINDVGAYYNSMILTLFSGEERNDLDYGFQYKPSSISGNTWEDFNGNELNDAGEMPLASIPVALYNENNELVKETLTDATGSYTFDFLNPGNYYVVFQKTGDYVFTMFGMDSDVNSSIVEGSTPLISLGTDTDILGIDAGYYEFAMIGDYIWLDTDRDGIQDSDESGIPNLDLQLLRPSGLIVNNTTNADGFYTYDLLPPGQYIVAIHNDSELVPSPFNQGNGANDSDDIIDVGAYYNSMVLTLFSGEERTDLDFGFQFLPASISGIAWEDDNADGINNANELRLAGVPVALFNASNVQLAQTTTMSDGTYMFNDLNPGNYYVVFSTPTDYVLTDFGMDSDVNESIVTGSTEIINVMVGSNITGVDVGYFQYGSIGDYLWIDEDRDGIQDNLEMGYSFIDITLTDASGNSINSQTSNSGDYIFDQLVPGEYFITIPNDTDLDPSISNQGNGINDSRSLTDMGTVFQSNSIVISSGEDRLNMDFGFAFKISSISGQVWEDLNFNGNDDNGETRLAGVEVTLFEASLGMVSSTTSDTDGKYIFDNLNPGMYYVVFNHVDPYQFTSMSGDSDVVGIIAPGATNFIMVLADQQIIGIDAGYYRTLTIGNYVWDDSNKNGLQDINETGIAGATIRLLDATGTEVDMSITNAQGLYQFVQVDPGTYRVNVEVQDDLVITTADQGNGTNDSRFVDASLTTNNINFNSGQNNSTIDFGFIKLSSGISGNTWYDLDADGIQEVSEPPVSGVTVELFAQGGALLGTTMTDALGNYAFDNLSDGSYYIVFESLADIDYTNSANDSDVTEAVVSGSTDIITLVIDQNLGDVDAGYIAYSSVGDYVWFDENGDGIQNGSESGIENVAISLFNQNGVEVDQVTSDADGNYLFNNVLPDDYYIVFSPGGNFTSGPEGAGNGGNDSDITDIFGNGSTSIFTLGFMQNRVDIDGGFEEIFATVSGSVFKDVDANGLNQTIDTPVTGILVELFDTNNVLVKTTNTNGQGNYAFNQVLPGDYYVKFGIPTGGIVTLSNQGTNDVIDSDITGTNGINTTEVFTLASMGNVSNVDGGFYEYAIIGNQIWVDENEDGLNNNNEPGLIGVTVSLLNGNGSVVDTDVSDANGMYLFDNIIPGTYQVKFEMPPNYEFTDANVGTDDAIDSDANNTSGTLGFTNQFMIACGEVNLDIDAGVILTGGGSLSGSVWEDDNADGINNNMESSLQDISVQLYSAAGVLLGSTVTDGNGDYSFIDIMPQQVYVVFTPSTGQVFSPGDVGSDDTVNSDVTGANGTGSTATINVMINTPVQNVDAGLYSTGTIGNFVWIDDNENGIQDAGEAGFNGAVVELYDDNAMLVASTMTSTINGVDGRYSFTNVMPGTYMVAVIVTGDYVFTTAGAGNGSNDSDIIPNGTGSSSTLPFALGSGQNMDDVDAGIFEVVGINLQGFAFEDLNANGLKDLTDNNQNGIVVNLYTEGGALVGTTITANDANGIAGFYSFVNVMPGNYYIEFIFPSGALSTLANVGNNDALDSDVTDANGAGTTDIINLSSGGATNLICGGYFMGGTIGDYVWNDMIANGIQDASEVGVDNVIVRLFDDANNQIMLTSTFTDGNGNKGFYQFLGVPPGNYYIRVDSGTGMTFTMANQGMDDNLDSDIDGSNGFSSTSTFTVASGTVIDHIDAGLLMQPASVGNYVWEDQDGDGVQDPAEDGIEGVVADLYNESMVFVATTSTDATGAYLFSNIQPGLYYIVFTAPGEYKTTIPDAGGNDTKDSDIMNVIQQGATNIFNLNSGENDMDIDGGFFLPADIGDYVWNDLDQDGIQDANEPGIEGVTVELRLGTFLVLETTVTDANGFFKFECVTQGVYSLRFSNIPSGFQFTTMDAGNDDTIDSDADPNGETTQISLAHGVDFMDLDAGAYDTNLKGNDKELTISTWPMPTTDLVHNKASSHAEVPLNWTIVNGLGQPVKHGTIDPLIVGDNYFDIDVSELVQGTYFIKYQMGGFKIVKPLIIGN